jgi:hypothetical protein
LKPLSLIIAFTPLIVFSLLSRVLKVTHHEPAAWAHAAHS